MYEENNFILPFGIQEPFWGRLFGFGTIIVTTGGATNAYKYIAKPLSFQKNISEEMDNNR